MTTRWLSGLLMYVAVTIALGVQEPSLRQDGYSGSRSCMECHERFYQLWSTSYHGLAMQPYRQELAAKLTTAHNELTIGKYLYRADLSGDTGWIHENGPDGPKRYQITQVLGGKNVYYFLTPMAKGRLQTLPLAYDVQQQQWFDMAASGIRHIPGHTPNTALDWKDWPYTFNTACHGCHVSQLTSNYDAKTDHYDTHWLEPGINCETCHGPSIEHTKLMQALPQDAPAPADLKLIRVKNFSPAQHNDACASCHAKAGAVTTSYPPGERFFDHYDLVTLEHSDYYPDGRDLGENYTYTSWRMNSCAQNSSLNCVTCHTSSGRYRFTAADKANAVCLPCHQTHVAAPTAHTHHQADGPGSRCIACHMPTTTFARMQRSDHSLRPPSPTATIRFQSPNACNQCHSDHSPEWADKIVRAWYPHDYQATIVTRAELIAAARQRDAQRLPEMLAAITDNKRDEILANSLLRLLRAFDDVRIQPVVLSALHDPSPLIRASAAESLSLMPTLDSIPTLVTATSDTYRLVRIRAAQALAGIPGLTLGATQHATVTSAMTEYLTALMVHPDQWTTHYNLGNYYLGQRAYPAAVAAFTTAIRFDPLEIAPRVNLAITHAQSGALAPAAEALDKALALAPHNAEANFNMGLLKAGDNDLLHAEQYLRTALTTDPQMAPAAYNLCVILGGQRVNEAVNFCRQAVTLRPQDARYAWTYAYYQNQQGEHQSAMKILENLVRQQPHFVNAYLLLADIWTQQGEPQRGVDLYNQALRDNALAPNDRTKIETALRKFKPAGQ